MHKEELATGKPIFMSWNITKAGTYVLFLNDVTDDKKLDAVRSGLQVKRDEDVATRVFIQCPIEFSKLGTDYITLEWMTLLARKEYFIWNGKIYAKIGLTKDRA